MADSLGKRFLSAWLKNPDRALFTEINFDDFKDDAKTAVEWVWAYHKDYGDWPNFKQLFENTGIELEEVEEPANYYSDLIRKRSLAQGMEKGLRYAISKLEKRDPDGALDAISDVSRYYRSRSVGKVVSHRETGEARLDEYDRVKKLGGLLGFATPWERLDRNIGGWVDGTLNVVTAHTNTGKTWFLCYCANHATLLGKRVLFVSLEMDTLRVQRRIDAIKYKIPFKYLRGHDMDLGLEEIWKDRVKRDALDDSRADILYADKKLVRYVDDVTNLVHDYQPDIVFIDGGYRFQSKKDKAGQWEQSARIVADLQLDAEFTGIPWVVSTQQGDSSETGKPKKGKKKIYAWGVRYAKEWVINPDNVIGLWADEDLRLVKVLEVHTLKMRDSTGDTVYPDFLIRWDLLGMDFRELSPVAEEEDTDLGVSHVVEI